MKAHPPRVAAGLLHGLDAAEAHEGRPSRFLGTEAPAHVLLGLELDVKA